MFDAFCSVRLVERFPLVAMRGCGLKERESCLGVVADLGGEKTNQLVRLSPRLLGCGLSRGVRQPIRALRLCQKDQTRHRNDSFAA